MVIFVRKYIVGKVKYHLYFEDPLHKKFSSVLQIYFKNSKIDMVKCTNKLIDLPEDEIKAIPYSKISRRQKKSYRGLDETEKKIKSSYYWTNQMRSIQNYIMTVKSVSLPHVIGNR